MTLHTMEFEVELTPDAADTRPLRDAFSRFATGVTVVTCTGDAGPVAMTANSFTSVSLEPPLVLWSVSRQSRRYPAFAAAEHYAIHVLGAEQRALSDLFAKDGLALAQMAHTTTARGVPVIGGCLARFECRRSDIHYAGDHALIVGEVIRAGFRKGDALAFFGGGMSPLAAS